MIYSLLLAGGNSSRMGQDKRQLKHEGKTLLEKALKLLEMSDADEILISGDVQGHECIQDMVPGCGPLGGLHAALHFMQEQGVLDEALLLVIPVDMPLLQVDTLTRLVDGIGNGDSCRYEKEVFPCVFKASSMLLEHLDDLLADSTELGGMRSMKALLEFGNPVTLEAASVPSSTFLNLNNPQDWQAYVSGIQ
jgi:molybdopterin-guanine dinucleotide biosynthesis protein A